MREKFTETVIPMKVIITGLPPGTVMLEPDSASPASYKPTEPLPGGITALVSNKNERTGMEIQATYKMSDSNTVVGE
ncbi:hypothetical protein QUF80_03515 [Desulfococcaceae bacterium HSG8]|nr:hypothetical protein [Desulfococcaceae bacterium HSG8]